jgi:hypothetical protein
VARSEKKEEEESIETEAADEIHRKPRCVCGEETEKDAKKYIYALFFSYATKLF